MAHESFTRDETASSSSDRTFGIVMATAFLLISLLAWLFGGSIRVWALICSVLFLIPALFAPRVLAPLNRLWLQFGLLLHRLVSPIVLGIMFFLVVTPTGMIMRAFGKDPLRRRIDKEAASYWIERTPPGPSPDSIKYQF